jgi:hypothetical protein
MTRKMFISIFGIMLASLLAIIAPAARADAGDQATQLTFNQPVQIPGNSVLPAGTYWFVLYDSAGGNLDTVQIFSADRNQVIATIMTVPTMQMTPPDQTELTFAQQSRNRPVALISWFYPGFTQGHEFVYSDFEEAQISEGPQFTLTAQPAR